MLYQKTVYYFAFAIVSLSFFACQPQKPQTEQVVIEAVKTEDLTQATGIGRVEPENKIIKINAEMGGLITAIRAKEGSTVKAGDIILELSHGVEDSRVGLAQSRIPTQKAGIADAQAAVTAADARIETARARLQAVQIRADAAKVRMNRLRAMLEKGAETQQIFDNTKAEYEGATQDARAAQAEIEAATKERDRTRTAVNTTQIRVNELEADVKVAQSQLAQRFVRAPYSGTLLSLEVTQGSNLAAGTSVGDFAPQGATVAVCEVDELFAMRVKEGQKAYIRTQGMNDTLSLGTVVYAAAYLKKKSLFSADAGELEDRRVREVRIKLDTPSKVLLGARIDYVILLK
jgi:multidrug resistance efflux pump